MMRFIIPVLMILAICACWVYISPFIEAPQPASVVRPKPVLPPQKRTLYLFFQPGCMPCKKLSLMLKTESLDGYDVVKPRVGDKAWKQYAVKVTPTMIAAQKGREIRRYEGCPKSQKELHNWLNAVNIGAFTPNGPKGPDGQEVVCDLPVEYRMKNVGGSDGAGLCVFTSINHSARLQNERRLWDFQKDMRRERGGGWPEKVDQMIEKYGKGTDYVQYEGRNTAFLELALKTGRMPSVTYNGHDGVFYRVFIAHMVNLVYLDDKSAAILDNNNIDKILWMSRQEFVSRWTGGRSGWAVVLCAPRPPNPPRN